MEDERPEEEPGFDPEVEWRFLEGDEVTDIDGEEIGIVVDFYPEDPEDGRPDFLIVEHGLFDASNLYVPFDVVHRYDVDRIVLNVHAADVESLGWHNPPEGVSADGG